MRLSRFTDIGLRAAMYLGARPGRFTTTPDLARHLGASRDHLSKSLQALNALNIVTSARGRGGGYAGVDGALDMEVGELVRALEPSVALAECFSPSSACPLTGRCRLAAVLGEARSAFFSALDQYTLRDLIRADLDTLVALEARSA